MKTNKYLEFFCENCRIIPSNPRNNQCPVCGRRCIKREFTEKQAMKYGERAKEYEQSRTKPLTFRRPTITEEIDQDEVLEAINDELEAPRASKFIVKKVRVRLNGRIVEVFFDLSNVISGLDEVMESWEVFWFDNKKYISAEILSIHPEDDKIAIIKLNGDPPREGNEIIISQPKYLGTLLEIWKDDDWFARIKRAHYRAMAQPVLETTIKVSPEYFQGMTTKQRECLNLVNNQVMFICGPPGTGKTVTLGRLLASALIGNDMIKILAISTTNNAVDQLLIGVDNALTEIKNTQSKNTITRIGTHFIAANYDGKEYLLPVADEKSVKEMIEHEKKKPLKDDIENYYIWKMKDEEYRTKYKTQISSDLSKYQLIALTSASALYRINELGNFDIVIFDEASMIGRANALPIAALGERIIYAGDDRQIAPIVQTDSDNVFNWLGSSMFGYSHPGDDNSIMLNEQFRMVEKICNLVSYVYYDGKLKLADSCKNDIEWHNERKVVNLTNYGENNIICHDVHAKGRWAQSWNGYIRPESADAIARLVSELINCGTRPEDIFVLTPFRAQRRLIRERLKQNDITQVKCLTVHRSQGLENHTIIFDPVYGEASFMQTDESARLINVAISRAKARLVIYLSENDRFNPWLKAIANNIELNRLTERDGAICLTTEIIRNRDEINKYIGEIVKYKNCIGKFKEYYDSENLRHLVIIDKNSGATREFAE